MLTSLAILAFTMTSPGSHGDALKGAEAYQQLRAFESQFLADAKSTGKPIDRKAEAAAFKMKADELLTGLDLASVPATEGYDWSHVLDVATRYQDSITVLDRYIADNPGADAVIEAKVAEVTDYRRLNQSDKATNLLSGLKPTTEKLAETVARVDATQAAMIARTGGEDAGLKFLDDVTPNFKGFDSKVTDILAKERTSLGMPSTRVKLIGASAPSLTLLPDKYGAFTDLAGLKGKVVVLDFFAHWCPPCKASFPDMRSMSDALGTKLAVVGVTAYYGSYEKKQGIGQAEEFADMKLFIDEFKIDHPVVYVDKGEFAKYGVSGIPEFVLIGKDGEVKKIQLGYDKPSFAEFRTAVEAEAAK